MFGWQAAYAQARRLEKKEDWAGAARLYKLLLKHGQPENPKVQFRMGYSLFRLNQNDAAIPHLERAVELSPNNANWEYRLAFVFERNKQYMSAIEHYNAALHLDPDQPKWEQRRDKCLAEKEGLGLVVERTSQKLALKDIVKNKGPAWARLDALEAGYASHRNDKAWLKDLAGARFGMNKYEDAAKCYAELLALDPLDVESHFMMGWAWQRCGRGVIAERSFLRAVELDTSLNAKNLGIGVFYQRKGQWRLAAEAYKNDLLHNPENAELNFRAGLALQKTFSWVEADSFLSRAIFLNPDIPMWHFRRGLSMERSGNLLCAADSYARAVRAAKLHSQYWVYRLGSVLAANGSFEDASDAYRSFYPSSHREYTTPTEDGTENDAYLTNLLIQSLDDALKSQSRELCEIVGRRAEAAGLFSLAERAYRAAVERSEQHLPHLYYRLGCVLAAQRKFEEATAAYSDLRIFKRAVGVDIAPYLKSPAAKKSMIYLEYAETERIATTTILYESSHGASISCNPLAMFRTIVADPRFAGFTHVWVLNDKKRIPDELRHNPDVLFVGRETELYLRLIASAKYLINNNTFPPYFVRRDEQQYLNTWHGTPIKTLGRDIKSGVMDHKNAARNFLQSSHMLFPNTFTADCLMNKYDIAALFTGKLAVTGYPRVDSTISSSADVKTALRRRLGIDRDTKIVLYAPTWRGTLANKNVDEARLARDLEAFGVGDWHFLYRGHSVDESSVSGSVFEKYSVPPDIDTNDLLAIVDVLVTDYSSIMFDFMPTARPIVYYAYDLDEYKAERGLYFDLGDMGGYLCVDLCSTLEAVKLALQSSGLGVEQEQKQLDVFHDLERGDSSRRAVDFFFFGSSDYVSTEEANDKPNALIFAGSFIPNGVTASYLNLANQLSPESYNLHLVVDPIAVASDVGRQAKFAANPSYVHAIGRVGGHLVTPDERWIIDKFNIQHNLDSEEMWTLYERAHRREFRRMFGTAEFDSIICFEGYARFWASVLGNPYTKPQSSSIFLHSVMLQEQRNRFPYLEGVFRLYGYYDQLISVSESASQDNARDLGEALGLSQELFQFTNNIVNPAETFMGADEELDADIASWLQQDITAFVSVGRLSPEKGYLKLIRAFALVVENCDAARLIVIGDGPMKNQMMDLISALDLDDYVYMAGMRMNPYPTVKRADCFVFSSDYEGQGIAVLEALILEKPVISTNVTGPRSILKGGHGLLVENTSQGLARGMISFIHEDLQFVRFDYETYQQSGVESFNSLALGTRRVPQGS